MSSSNLIRLGGLAAALGGAMLVVVGLAQLVWNLLFPNPGAFSGGAMTVSSIQLALALLGQPLVVLGLVGLYAHQSEVTGIFGLIGFLVTFVGTLLVSALGVEGVEGVAPLASLGWALVEISRMKAGNHPRM